MGAYKLESHGATRAKVHFIINNLQGSMYSYLPYIHIYLPMYLVSCNTSEADQNVGIGFSVQQASLLHEIKKDVRDML